MKNIIFFRTDRLGDFLIITNIIKALKDKYPKSKITVVASQMNYHFIKKFKIIDRVILFNKNYSFLKKIDIFKIINDRPYDVSFSIDGKTRMSELISDGVLLSTPAGSTAYNYSATGPILPIGSDLLALTALNAFRPHRWRGALIPKRSRVEMVVLEPEKRPIMADADSRSVKNVAQVNISSADDIEHRLLFDPGHGLEERLISEQFI